MRFPFLVVAILLTGTDAIGAQTGPSPESVRRLAPSSFPQVPAAIRHDLERRRCFVPQPYNARIPANVAHGAFISANTSAWAILCSVQDTSQILIYHGLANGDARALDSLERAPDSGWMQRISNTQWGFSRLLRALPNERIRSWRRDDAGRAIPRPIDHDAIEQTFLGKAADAFYHAAGQWYRRATMD